MKKGLLLFLFITILLLFGCNEEQKSSNIVSIRDTSSNAEIFEDPNFEKLVRNAIRETIDADFEGAITKEKLNQLGEYFSKADNLTHMKYMSIPYDVKSVAGIEHIEGFQHLFINSEHVDLSAVQKLNSLLSATIQTNSSIEDITPLNKVNSLGIINTTFKENQLESFSNLISFYMFSEDVSAQKVIKNLLSNKDLKKLEIANSNGNLKEVKNLKVFSQLKSLILDGNQIKDITPLSKLKNLTKISLRENEIENIKVLLDLPKLEYIDLEGNPLNEKSDAIIEKLEKKNIHVMVNSEED